jgi:hypothetical protein
MHLQKIQDFVEVAPFLHCFTQGGAVMVMRNEYEPYSAVTFLLLGLGIGTVVALVCNPKMRQRVELERINSWRTPGSQPREEAEEAHERIA